MKAEISQGTERSSEDLADALLDLLTQIPNLLPRRVLMKPPLRMLNLLPSFSPVPPHVIGQPVERRERRDPEGAGGQESGDSERDGERGGDDDGAEEEEERGGDGEGDESADEGEAGEAEEEGAEG
nr:hypothetical protein Saspl_029611 [Ipomoea trifida]